ncbi:phosphotransferase family protein [Miltoncostaea marina]|uniref:phosphotransferase family protein n=1 Tax=Miltoncostaea marina TaxID=2843215 RepID=UPI001C3DF5FF|nr:phosphotransferase [Miltoncostaea marina]
MARGSRPVAPGAPLSGAGAELRRLLAAHLPELAGAPVRALGAGTDHAATLVGGRMVVRVAAERDPAARAAAVRREARLLEAIGDRVPVAVPRPALAVPDRGLLAYPLLPGAPLLALAPGRRAAAAPAVGATLGGLLAALQAVPETVAAGLADPDDDPPDAWLAEAAELYAAVAGAVPRAHRPAIEAFLAARPPAPPARLTLCHCDLGAEHVLVAGPGGRVTGVIDWGDAALADPARDLGRVLRDLGPAGLRAALAAMGGEADAGLRERALFHARCALLEDLAYGVREGRPAYVAAGLAALAWVLPA